MRKVGRWKVLRWLEETDSTAVGMEIKRGVARLGGGTTVVNGTCISYWKNQQSSFRSLLFLMKRVLQSYGLLNIVRLKQISDDLLLVPEISKHPRFVECCSQELLQ